ncbi:MAG: hypothetical protein E6246_08350 [Veillonella sp.]|nr:hypothetical protein [Veillonella sp.]
MAKEHQVLIIAKNAPGIGTRILALFNRRGFNVTKMTSYRGNVLDISPTSMIIEVIGSVEKLRGFIQIMETYGILEIAKTGITAMSRGEKM